MCGFTGVVSFNEINSSLLELSNRHSVCRGPDNLSNTKGFHDIYYDFWFNRLSIVDLSSEANQPMNSQRTNSILMFNGEIYNSQYLRNKIIKNKFDFQTSHSDTETLLAGLEVYGIEFIQKIDGQFSFIYFDKPNKKIFLGRDRLGQKPLYYKLDNKSLSFASNLKSLLELSHDLELDENSLHQYIRYGINFTPNTLFTDFYKLNPGTYTVIDYSNNYLSKNEHIYWSPDEFVDNKKFNLNEFYSLFSEAVEKRMISDVPIATFLSGGIDSTSIVKKLFDLDFKVNTFSVIVKNKKFNEKKYIDQVVNKYKTNHKDVIIDENISNNLVLSAIKSLDEPYSDPSIVPTFFLSQLMSKDYKVAISGDGGDELLGGYYRMKNHLKNKNIYKNSISKLYKFYPTLFGTGTKFMSLSSNQINSYLAYLEDQKFSNKLFENEIEDNFKMKATNNNNIYKEILKCEYKYYLSNQMMFKVDRASMANSLEVRSPFVDHKLVEYVFSHSTEYFDSNTQKYPLYNFLSSDFDQQFLKRPKQGFIFDYRNWVFLNMKLIYEEIEKSKISKYLNTTYILNLQKIPSRVNALRIWKVFVLSVYLNDVNNL